MRTVTPLVPPGRPERPYGGVDAQLSPAPPDEKCRRANVSSEPEHLGMTGSGPSDSRRTPAGPLDGTPGPAAAESWAQRLVRSLVLLDAWSPDSHRLSSPQAARRYLRTEWTSSGDLTEAQAAALVVLDETTAWRA